LTESKPAEDAAVVPLEPISEVRPIELTGGIDAGTDLSGVVVVDDFLVLGADEGHQLRILRRDENHRSWRLEQRLILAERGRETDIAAIAFGRGQLYVVGSHSRQRRKLQPEFSVRKNRQRFFDTDSESSRNRLYRLSFDPKSGKSGETLYIDLCKRLRKDPLLKPFAAIPRKENGIDINGMTFADDRLYLGFRGPVLRENYVPVMTLEFERPKGYELSFVRLDGQGIRDLAALEHGFLILSGPANDTPGPFCLWWWDGTDQVPGKGRRVRDATMLGTVSTPGGAWADGLTVVQQTDRHADVVLVYETNTAAQVVGMRVVLPD
jgi:hypothetical protein